MELKEGKSIRYTEQVKNDLCFSLFLEGATFPHFPLGDFPGPNKLWPSITEKVAEEGDSDLKEKWPTLSAAKFERM